MANEQNLISITDRSEEEARAIRSAGGKAKAELYRQKKTIAEVLKGVLDEQNTDGVTKRELIVQSCLKRAFEKGSVQDLERIANICGESVQKVEVETKGNIVLLPDEVIDSINKAKK